MIKFIIILIYIIIIKLLLEQMLGIWEINNFYSNLIHNNNINISELLNPGLDNWCLGGIEPFIIEHNDLIIENSFIIYYIIY